MKEDLVKQMDSEQGPSLRPQGSSERGLKNIKVNEYSHTPTPIPFTVSDCRQPKAIKHKGCVLD